MGVTLRKLRAEEVLSFSLPPQEGRGYIEECYVALGELKVGDVAAMAIPDDLTAFSLRLYAARAASRRGWRLHWAAEENNPPGEIAFEVGT